MPYEIFLIILLGFNLIFGALAAYLASRWRRDPFGWLLVGTVLGPLALILLVSAHVRDARLARPRLAGPSAAGLQPGKPTILIAVDGSAMSDQAVQYVIRHFGASLGEVGVIGVLAIERGEGVAMEEGSPRRQMLEEEIERHLESACSALRDAGVRCRSIVRFGDPATEIVSEAKEADCDLIVMGRRGRGGVGKLLLGSVSEKVTKQAGCPVTVVG
jgi:nucleotide-binding universal stress UspA family protein